MCISHLGKRVIRVSIISMYRVLLPGLAPVRTNGERFHSEDIGSIFGPKGFARGGGVEPACLIVEVAPIIVHEADEPNPILGLCDADGLAGKELTEIDLLAVEADAAARGHGDG